jgi:hypothetical protein
MAPGLNDSPRFIEALAGLVRRAVSGVFNAEARRSGETEKTERRDRRVNG